MKKRRYSNLRLGTLLVSFVMAIFLWSIAHGVTTIERAFDIPIELRGLGDELVVTDQDPDAINVRILGSQAALRQVEPDKLIYDINVAGSKPGDAIFEVDVSQIQLPRGARIVSRSPSRILLTFEPRGRKAVGVRVEQTGEPAAGYVLEGIEVVPKHVWLTGARSQVMGLREVVTEPIDLAGLKENTEREVRLFIGADHVSLEKNSAPVKVVVRIGPELIPDPREPEREGNGAGPEKS